MTACIRARLQACPGVCTFWSGGEISVDNSPRPLAGKGGPRSVGEGLADFGRRKQPLTPGFAVPSPLGGGRYQLRPAVNPNAETPGHDFKSCRHWRLTRSALAAATPSLRA